MSMSAATPIWDGVRRGSEPIPVPPLPVHRDDMMLFGVTAGTVSVLVRAVGEDGRRVAAHDRAVSHRAQVHLAQRLVSHAIIHF